MRVTAGPFDYRRCPTERMFELVFPVIVSTRDDGRIKEDRGLGELGRRRR
jgi:hypothetical protein